MKIIPNYHPPSDYRRPTKTQEKVYVPVNDYPEINFSMITKPQIPPPFPFFILFPSLSIARYILMFFFPLKSNLSFHVTSIYTLWTNIWLTFFFKLDYSLALAATH